MTKAPKLIVIAGPTAVGKTKTAIQLAQQFDGEIINSDAMQVYQHLDIGTATPTAAEQAAAVHHLINIRAVDEPYSVAEFQADAMRTIEEIATRGHVPIVVGGTGLYLQALLFDFALGQDAAHPDFRREMTARAEREGSEALHAELAKVDHVSAERIHPNNVRRVIRALEIATFTDHKLSDQRDDRMTTEPRYPFFFIALETKRSLLYERINQRVDQMLADGLLAEARWLYDQHLPKGAASMQAIGYKELFPYFKHPSDAVLAECVTQLKRASRRYAKRQLTWIRHRLPEAHTVDLVQHPEQLTPLMQAVAHFLAEDEAKEGWRE